MKRIPQPVRQRIALAALTVALATPAASAPVSVLLTPATAAIGFRAYELGLIPVDGQFARFGGALEYDDAAPGQCRVTVTVQVASLILANDAMRRRTLAPGMLDAAAFPTLAFTGACRDSGLEGSLTLHGVTRPLRLDVVRDGPGFGAQAALRRTDWGIDGLKLLAGDTIRIQVRTRLQPP